MLTATVRSMTKEYRTQAVKQRAWAGLLTRYFRLWRKLRHDARMFRSQIEDMVAANKSAHAEASRLRRQNDALQTKVETLQRTMLDKVLEAVKLAGNGKQYASTDAELRNIREEITTAIDDAERELDNDSGNDLSADQMDEYEAKKERHWEFGRMEGLDEKQIENNWKKYEAEIRASLSH
jgi:hypothetical protein